ncbi:L-sorbose 1-phosphate reductase [candidate division KSB3 bacterium]|uniref:L-sorbose 1-phosphate reductase n=1 Tax=candidate division KSB3 bacterium TaxID=2044937 RepID=A0A2G6E1W1_9BACT|nr:MAG: L-sorbose 1-phosphate reductase [candidate division KSB3 bacterium]PIE28679.1 MAG: L-sorbose 1-phosphate reductase [candidate division KSB3 bacterium]
MKTTALRIYGEKDLRLETFDLPPIQDNEILIQIISNSICMSSHKAAKQGAKHKRIPNDVAEHPTLLGHEFSGRVVEVGAKYKGTWEPGQLYGIQPATNYPDGPVGVLSAPGYSYQYLGGNATYAIVPEDVLKMDCLLPYSGNAFFKASLAEPMSCIIGAVNAQYHVPPGTYEHHMGIVDGGNMALLAGCGPMGLGMIDFALHGPRQPKLLMVVDIDSARIQRAQDLYSVEDAASRGVRLVYVNSAVEDLQQTAKSLTDGKMMDDVFVFAPIPVVFEQGQSILGFEGSLNFFAGPTDTSLSARLNIYDVHYNYHKVLGTSGGNTNDMRQALELMSAGKIDPSVMVTHIGGITAAAETILDLPEIPGGKKLLYTEFEIPLFAIADVERLSMETEGPLGALYKELTPIISANKGLWSADAEHCLLGFHDRLAYRS